MAAPPPDTRRIAFLVHLAEMVNHYRDVWQQLDRDDVIVIPAGDPEQRSQTSALAQAAGLACVSMEDALASGRRYPVLVSNHPLDPSGPVPLIRRLGVRNARFNYALGKSGWNLRPWNALYDLILCFGPYHVQAYAAFAARKVQIGYPRFDRYFNETIDRRALVRALGGDPDIPSIVWLPTWKELSSVGVYDAVISDLTRKFNVFVKLHPLMVTEEPERVARLRAHPYTTLITDSYDNLNLFRVADLMLCDYGGSPFGAIYVGLPFLLLDVAGAAEDALTGQDSPDITLRRYLPSVQRPQDLLAALEDPRVWDVASAAHRQLRDFYFAPLQGRSARAAADAILELASAAS
ncbi:MAG: CDP-glycerol glycerophosphotransferase family protein [Curvibacter sp.]|nr:CDP-glycerol glycerophosphotransferase family protein [Curvibacter sp.]